MLIDYVPTMILAGLAKVLDTQLQLRGFKIKQHYLIHSLYCSIAFLLTIPDFIALYTDFGTAYNLLENTGWWATRWLMCYELYYILEHCNGRLNPDDIINHTANFIMLWVCYMLSSEGALYGAYLGLVVCLPEALSSFAMFVLSELDWISINQFKGIIEVVNNYYRLGLGIVLYSIRITCAIWLLDNNIPAHWNIVVATIQLLQLLMHPWMMCKEPYEACNALLSNS